MTYIIICQSYGIADVKIVYLNTRVSLGNVDEVWQDTAIFL